VNVAFLPPDTSPVEVDNPGLADAFRPPDELVDVTGAGLAEFCPGLRFGTTVPELGKPPTPGAE
jgi:hypothetical protein